MRKGFTLIEMLVVVGIIAILMGAGMAAIGGLAALAFSTWRKVFNDVADAIVAKWQRVQEIINDNWRATTRSMGEAVGRLFKSIDGEREKFARRSGYAREMQGTIDSNEDAATALRRAREMQEVLDAGGDASGLRKQWEYEDKRLKLMRALHALEDPARETVYLRALGGFSFREIGSILGMSENAARVTYFRGRQKLRKELEENE